MDKLQYEEEQKRIRKELNAAIKASGRRFQVANIRNARGEICELYFERIKARDTWGQELGYKYISVKIHNLMTGRVCSTFGRDMRDAKANALCFIND